MCFGTVGKVKGVMKTIAVKYMKTIVTEEKVVKGLRFLIS